MSTDSSSNNSSLLIRSNTSTINSINTASSTTTTTNTSSSTATPPIQQTTELKGWLYKWTNYLKGYQKRWFVLSNNKLSYYRNPMEISQSCRGSINLVSALIHTEESCNFVVANGATQTYHLRAANEVDKQKWVTALELAKVRAIRQLDAEDDDFFDLAQNGTEIQLMLKQLQTKLDLLSTCIDVVGKHGTALQRILNELEQTENQAEIFSKIKAINERATLYRITSGAMLNASVEYYNCAQTHNKKLQKMLQHEFQTRVTLEDLVEQLAKQHSHLEQRAIEHQQASEHSASSRREKSENENTEDEEFYDAEENTTAEFVVTFPGKAHRIHSSVAQSSPSPIQLDERSASENSDISNNFNLSSSNNNNKNNAKQRKKRFRNRNNSNNNNYNKNNKSQSINDSSNSNDEEDNNNNFVDDDFNSYSEDNDEIEIDVVTRKSVSFSNQNNSNFKNNNNNDAQEQQQNPDKTNDNNNGDGDSDRLDSSSNNALIKSNSVSGAAGGVGGRQRRTKIPYRPNHSLNLWSIMKNCIGKELTKIPMPVNFNEPLSMLQRMTEEFEYADILHKAAKMSDPLEQMVYVAVFSVTCYATTSNRTSKPFNPLLGETYECDRLDDLGWKCISEQVSHHPPMLAQHCEAKDWNCWREFAMTSKFRGKYLLINPLDITHLEFPGSGNHYTWRKVNTTVNNIIVGKLWVDNHGEMTITNHKTGDYCHLNFQAYSYFSRDVPRKVTGVVVSKDEKIKWVLNGTWDNKMEAAKVLNPTHVTTRNSKPVIETGTPKLIWKRNYPPAEYEKMYNMTVLAVQLNEPEDGVAPTDSRLRPDQRLMEEGKWDEANEVKSKLEEKQRQTRRKREEEAEKAAAEGRPYVPYEPAWFKKNKDPITGNPVHMFTKEYWQCKQIQDWSRCPDIYLDPENDEL